MEHNSFGVRIGRNEIELLITTEAPELRMLAVQLAANILTACREYPVEEDKLPSTGPGRLVKDRMPWAPHGITNAMQSQVSLLYAIVEMIVENYPSNAAVFVAFDGMPFAQIVTDALTAYQGWKEKVCEKQREAHGPNWGSATGFFRADWTDLNEKLLGLTRW